MLELCIALTRLIPRAISRSAVSSSLARATCCAGRRMSAPWCLTRRRVWARPIVLCSCFAKTPANIPASPRLCRDVRVLHKKKFAGSAVALLALVAAFAAPTGWTAPLEVYGKLPSVEDVALSPDGSRLAMIRTVADDRRMLVVISVSEHKVLG